MEGEGVDSYLNELKRLGRIAKASEDTIQCSFILGLLTEVAERLRATPKVQQFAAGDGPGDGQGNGAPGGEQKGGISSIGSCKESRRGVVAVAQTRTKKGCFECGQNHFVRNCPEVKNGIGQRTGKRYGTGGQRGGQPLV